MTQTTRQYSLQALAKIDKNCGFGAPAGIQGYGYIQADWYKASTLTIALNLSQPGVMISCANSQSAAPSNSDVKVTEPSNRNTQAIRDAQRMPVGDLKFLTVAQTAQRYPAYSEKAIRHLIAQAESYYRYPKTRLRSNNGFIACILRPAGQRKIIIEAEKFEQWLRSFSAEKA